MNNLFKFTLVLLTFITLSFKPVSVQNKMAQYSSALVISVDEFTALSNGFKNLYPKASLGGAFSKAKLQALLDNMPEGSVYVNYRMVKDPETGSTAIALRGKSSDASKALRNGGAAAAFCPTACDFGATGADMSVEMTNEEFEAMSKAYMDAYPKRTAGGNIDKAALIDIIKSLPDENNLVHFRFFKDASGKTGVMFLGGKVNQENNNIFCARNGASIESFCPTNCDR